MKKINAIILSICLLFVFAQGNAIEKKSFKVLIFSKTNGYRHKSIPDGIQAIKKLGLENGFIADTTENAAKFTPGNLKKYKVVIFLNPTGEIFNDQQKQAFQDYIRKGGGFVGLHSATDCSYKWEWYGKMIGAYFESHPKIQTASVRVVDSTHVSTKGITSPWLHKEEWYNFTFKNPSIKVLMKVDESSYKGGKNGAEHPVAWYHEFEGGRVFYTALGHVEENYKSDQMFLNHLLGGIKYAAGIS